MGRANGAHHGQHCVLDMNDVWAEQSWAWHGQHCVLDMNDVWAEQRHCVLDINDVWTEQRGHSMGSIVY